MAARAPSRRTVPNSGLVSQGTKRKGGGLVPAAGKKRREGFLVGAQDVDGKPGSLWQERRQARLFPHRHEQQHRFQGQRRHGVGGHAVHCLAHLRADDRDARCKQTNRVPVGTWIKRCCRV
jgi:hypothetical protein